MGVRSCTTWHGGAYKVCSPAPGSGDVRDRKWLCPPACHPKHTYQMKSLLSRGRGRPKLAYWSPVLTEGKLMSGQRPPTSPTPTQRGRDDIRLGKPIVLGSWLPSHTEDTHQGHALVPSSAPVPLGLASHSKECLLTPTVHQGSVGGKTERQEAQGNGGVSKLNSPSCQSQVGSLGLTESGTQAAFSLFPVVAPGGCASSSHHVFIPPSQRKEKGGQFTHHSA